MYKYKNREEVPTKYKWDLTDFFKSDEEFQKSLKEGEAIVENLKSYKDTLFEGNNLYEYLKKDEEASSLVQNLYVYSYLKNDEELGIKENIERKNLASTIYKKLDLNTSFFSPSILNLNETEYKNLFKKNTELLEYKPYLDKIYRKKDHILNEREENIISELNSSNNSSDISSNLINKEHNYGKIKLSDGTYEIITVNNYHNLMKEKDRNIRKKVYNSFNKKLDEYGVTEASLLNSYVKKNNTLAKLHNFANAWDSKLFGLNLSNEVFNKLVSAVEENTESLQSYFKLRKKIMNINKLMPYDLNIDLTKSNKEYTVEEAESLIKEALKPLGKSYGEKLNKIFKNRYIDYMGYKGKCSGGYSFSTLTNDSRILMSYNSDLDSISTIIHESGHNIHHQFLKENNPLIYRDQSTIICEVASLTNECLLSSYLLKNSKSKEEKLASIENMIRVIRTNLFGAVREGKIEEEMYEIVDNNGTLTKESLSKLVEKSLYKYYGYCVDIDKYSINSWITRSHYFMNFYLYSYAISISVAINVFKSIEENEDMLNKYLQFLSAGSNIEITDAFKILNIDLEDKKIYINAINYFNELVTTYENIYFDKEV